MNSRALAVAACGTTLAVTPIFLTGALGLFARSDLGFDARQLGLTVSAFWVTGAVAGIAAGRFCDRAGPKRAIVVATLISCVSLTGLGAFSRSWLHFTLFLAVGALANAIMQPAANLAMSFAIEPGRQGLAFGVKQTSSPAAGMLAGVAVPAIGLTIGWRWAYIFAAALGALVLILNRGMHYENASPAQPDAKNIAPPSTERRRTLIMLAVASGCGFGASIALTTYLVESLVVGGMEVGRAGLLFAVGGAFGSVTRLGSGILADKRPAAIDDMMMGMFVAGIAGFVCLVYASSLPFAVLGTILGFAGAWGWPALLHFSTVRRNSLAPGAATGVVVVGVSAGGAMVPPLLGVILENHSFPFGWGAAAIIMVVGSLLLVPVRRDRSLQRVTWARMNEGS